MSQPTVPPFHGSISFHAQHSPMGAFFSFTCGHFGSKGGFGLQSGKPGNQDLYIGIKDGDRFSDAPLKCLPFYEGAKTSEAERYDVEKKSGAKPPALIAYKSEEIKRHYGWATDRWVTPEFEFAIYTPFWEIPDPATQDMETFRNCLHPSIASTLQIDNTNGTQPKTVVFAIRWGDVGARLLNAHDRGSQNGKIKGFALADQCGVRAQVSDETHGEERSRLTRESIKLRMSGEYEQASGLRAKREALEVDLGDALTVVQGFDLNAALRNPEPHQLGGCTGLAVTVPPGRHYVLEMTFGVYLGHTVTTGIEATYRYTRAYTSLDDVLQHGVWIYRKCEEAEELDVKLLSSGLSADQQFLIAHSTRSYYGSTQLLDVGGEPFWIVNEGEYCMLNTLDLSVDHVFWELQHNPWVVKNLLNNFVRHYSYVDEVKATGNKPGQPLLPGGISFCHDMGVNNNFSPRGNSSYELSNLNAACFSYMTQEELCNWILCAACYVHRTNDLAWARHQQHVIEACLTSMLNRGGEAGFAQYDSSRCGPGGAEITTYDSLDHSLAQTRNNVYIAIKCWASYLGLELILNKLKAASASKAREAVGRVERFVLQNVGADGILPAVFEKDNPGFASRILPAIEGLMYPLYWGGKEAMGSSPLLNALKTHTLKLMKDSEKRNLFPDGGIRLSSTSGNSWMSKIAIFQHVCRKVLHLEDDPQIKAMFASADAAHVQWMTTGESAYWACSDQFVDGVAKGSKYYPRIITTALWLD